MTRTILLLALLSLLFAACGGDSDSASPAATATATTGDGGAPADDGGDATGNAVDPAGADGEGFVLDLGLGDIDPDDPLPTGPPGGDDGEANPPLVLNIPTPTPVPVAAEPTAEPTTTPTTEPDPLETVIIDDRPSTIPSFQLDENAALACAHAEFALDALIADDAAELDRTMNQAAAWAEQSGDAGMREIAPDLASVRDPAEAERLVLAVLQACTAAGYEL